jgi:BirA family biotin operon repressor/biotin-[acetyl-CoA-carboxylase] ligase
MKDNIQRTIENKLDTGFIGRQLHYFKSVTSTMKVARNLARDGAPEGTVVIAEKQTTGRGRLGRVWLTPKGNLAISIILRPELNDLPRLIMIASLAVIRGIETVTGLKAQIKWPNDVLIKNKKVCGILIESEIKNDNVSFTIIGMGINTSLNPGEFPEIQSHITSLKHELGNGVSTVDLCCSVLNELEKLYLSTKAGAPIHSEWVEHMETIGKLVQVKVGDSVEQGIAETVTEDGNLVLRHADGSHINIAFGDVTIIKK